MKRKHIFTTLSFSILTAFSLSVHAQMTDYAVRGFVGAGGSSEISDNSTQYLGINYPQPDAQEKKYESISKSYGINDLLSNNIERTGKTLADSKVSEMRRSAIEELAGSLGSSSGLQSRMNEIKLDVDKNARELDSIYDFARLAIDNGVLPPVITEGLANYNQESDDEVRIADKMYKIELPARFVPVYPNWRNYLVFRFPSYEISHGSFLPQNSAEKAIWDNAIKVGWARGVNQANHIFEASFNRMQRDYMGMIKYHILLSEGMVTPTLIAKHNMGVTGGGREMSINDQVMRISDHSGLNPVKGNWKTEYPVSNNVNGTLK